MSTNEPPTGTPGEPTPPPPSDPGYGQSAAPPPPPPPPPAQRAASRCRRPVPPPRASRVSRAPVSCWTGSWPGSSTAIILGVVYGIIVGIVGGVLITGFRSGGELFLYYLIISVVSTALYLGYYAYLESSRGQTVGKMVMKLKVVRSRRRQQPDAASRPSGATSTWPSASLGIVPVIGSLLGGLASLAAVIMIALNINGDTVRRQHWFDKFAGGTQVMKIG